MKTSASLLPLAAALLVAACGDSPTGGTYALTQDEAESLMRATMGQVSVGTDSQIGAGAATLRAPTQTPRVAYIVAGGFVVSQNFSESEPCDNPEGRMDLAGVLTITGTDDGPTGVELSATMTPVRCAITTDDANVYEINGDPNFVVHLSMAVADGELVGGFTETITGKFTWRNGSRSGVCSVNLTSEFDAALGREHTRGTFCGVDVDEVEIQ